MDHYCAFIKSTGQPCFTIINPDETICLEHSFAKCTVCGTQATESCSKIGLLNCWVNLCGDTSCHLLHQYISHPNLIQEISQLENEQRVEPVKILVGKINRLPDDPSEIYKAGFLIPYQNGGFIWTTIFVQNSLSDIEDKLNDTLKGTNEREVIYTERFYNSKIPPGTLEEIIS
jgi:hypothetical protein